jgi:phospholipase/lecithinase/hemolysin
MPNFEYNSTIEIKREKLVNARRWSKLLVLAILSLTAVSSAFGQEFNRVVIFGDSLSDPGNYFAEFHTALVPPFLSPLPDAPYAIGGLHFTNGPTWAEQFTKALHLRPSGLPAFVAPQSFDNYAVGRARARANAPVFPYFDLTAQVDQFLQDGKTGSSTDLVAIWIGANDVGDALSDPADAQAIIFSALNAEAVNIQRLYAAGARNFLVLNQPNIGLTPLVSSLGPQAVAGATQLDAVFNYYLDQTLTALTAMPGTKFFRVDTNALLNGLVADPLQNGLENVTNSCLTFGVTAGAFCHDPDGYLFWDGFHPTTTGHSFVARAALQAIGATVQ